jgi:hypothetical protein
MKQYGEETNSLNRRKAAKRTGKIRLLPLSFKFMNFLQEIP